LEPGTRLTVTIDTAFAAMDGSRLGAPYRFEITVPGPRLLSTAPAGAGMPGRELASNARLSLVFSAPLTDTMLTRVVQGSRLEFEPACAGTRVVRLRLAAQRVIDSTDSYQ